MNKKKTGEQMIGRCYVANQEKGGQYQMPIRQKVVTEYECTRCGHRWVPRSEELPVKCANHKCSSPYWNRQRKRKSDDNKE